MNKKIINVKRWISEENDQLDKIVTNAINKKEKVHVKSPVHTGKTTFAIDQIIKRKKEQQILVLAPQIAITTHIYNELKKKNVQSFIFNGDTKKDFLPEHLLQPILSTIDSAHLFFEGDFEHKLDPEKAVVIIDETHAFIQDGKEDYDKTVRAILNAGCPLIGFSATPSAWVTEYLLEIDESIEIVVTDLQPKEILSVVIEKNLLASVAHAIKIEKFKKVVIFTSGIDDQEKIAQEVKVLLPEMKCLILNRPNRLTTEEDSWSYLLENGSLPEDTDVLLMNKVAQAGININDKDIDAVFLVGSFDPIGFLQYLGRCRNYSKEYYFFYRDSGKVDIKYKGAAEHDRYQKLMQKAINLFAKAENLTGDDVKLLFNEAHTVTSEGEIILNKCVLAKKNYENFNGLRGDVLVDFMKLYDPTLKLSGDYTFEGIDTSINQSKQHKRRKSLRKQVAKAIVKNATYLYPMVNHLKTDLNYSDATDLIQKSSQNKSEAKKKNVLHLPPTKKKSIEKMLKAAKDAGIGIPKLLVASKKYIDKKNDPKVIDQVLKMSNLKIVRTLKAYLFYDQNLGANSLVSNILDDLEKKISTNDTAEGWKSWIKSKIGGLAGSDKLANTLYDCCCKMKAVQISKNGVKMKRRRLEKVIRTYKDYVTENNLKDIF